MTTTYTRNHNHFNVHTIRVDAFTLCTTHEAFPQTSETMPSKSSHKWFDSTQVEQHIHIDECSRLTR